jgi:hypothetical protein
VPRKRVRQVAHVQQLVAESLDALWLCRKHLSEGVVGEEWVGLEAGNRFRGSVIEEQRPCSAQAS